MTRRATSAAARCLSAFTYLARNPRRVLPIALVQALVAALEIAALTPLNAFESTADMYIRPLEYLTIVTPLRRSDFNEDLRTRLDANPHQERRLKAKAFWFNTPAIMGDLTSPLLALREADQQEFLDRMGLTLARGRLPEKGSAGAAVHAALLRARGIDIGGEFGRIVNPKDMAPGRFEVVGVLEGEPRVGLVDLEHAMIPDFVLARLPAFQVIYAKPGEKAESDAFLRQVSDDDDRRLLRVVDEAWVREVTRENLQNLPLIVGFITAVDAIIVAFVVMLIAVISFQARTDEFALYLAVGHKRGRLLAKLTTEATITALAGWALGVGLGLATVALYDHFLMAPKAIVIRVVDPTPILYSLMVPVLSAVVSAVALGLKLTRMDPVSVIQRRGG